MANLTSYNSFLSFCKDLFHFLFTILHLLLTRILPLLALLLVSLLLHLFHFISTSLRPSSASTQSSLFKQRCAAAPLQYGRLRLQLGAGSSFNMGAVYSDALQEDQLQRDDDQLSPAYALHEEGNYEDCVDEFIEEQRSLMSKDEGISSCQYGPDSLKKRRQGPAEGGESLRLLEVGDSLQEVGDSLQKVAGDFMQEEVGGSQAPRDLIIATSLQSEPSLFPSDLPPSLDHIVKAATANRTSEAKPTRALPPTLSSIEKALLQHEQQSSPRRCDVQSSSEFEVAMQPAAPPALSTSSGRNFMAKFNQHFMVDGQPA